MYKPYKIAFITGRSGAGKSTTIKYIMKMFSTLFEYWPSTSTRKRRQDESDGNPYYFVNENEFKKLVKIGRIVEWNKQETGLYGKDIQILQTLDTNKIILAEIEIEKINEIKKILKKYKIVTIFLTASQEEINHRLGANGRNDDSNIKASRDIKSIIENNLMGNADIIITSIDGDMFGTAKQVALAIQNYFENKNANTFE